MKKFKTEKRLEKISRAVKARQPSLSVILENIHDPHNVSAIFRTCDAVGVPKVSLLYNLEEFPKISKVTSASAFKWVDKDKFTDTKTCFDYYRKKGFKIYASLLSDKAVSLYDIDFTQKVAIVLGNEHRGISEDVAKLADEVFYIPMDGMIQSLNVSVATAVTLYEVKRQRILTGMYDKSEQTDEEIDKIIDDWCER